MLNEVPLLEADVADYRARTVDHGLLLHRGVLREDDARLGLLVGVVGAHPHLLHGLGRPPPIHHQALYSPGLDEPALAVQHVLVG